MEFNGNTYFIFNKKYQQAKNLKIAQFGTHGRNIGTFEQVLINYGLLSNPPDQDIFTSKNNAYHKGYCLVKWGNGDEEFGVFNGQFL